MRKWTPIRFNVRNKPSTTGTPTPTPDPTPPSGEATYALTDTINYQGETYTLNKNAKVGYSLNGAPFIVSDSTGLTWVSSSTPSATVNGYTAYGAMFDPWIIGTYEQGFDAMWANGNLGTNELGASGSVPYVPAKNIHPANSGSPFNITVGMCGRLAQMIRRADYQLGQFCIPSKINHINIVPSIPPAGAIAPIYNGDGTVEWITTASFNKNVFANHGYIANEVTLATCLANNYLPTNTDWPLYIDNGEFRRGAIPYNTNWVSGYSRDFGGCWNSLLNALHAEGTGSLPDAVLYQIVTIGAQCIENVRRGNVQRGGAGQNVGLKPMAAATAFMAQNETIFSQSQTYEGNETHQAFWPTSAFRDINANYPGGSGTAYQNRTPFLTSLSWGRGAFLHGGTDLTTIQPSDLSGLWDSDSPVRYQITSWSAAALGLANIGRFVNGVGSKNGWDYILKSGPVSTSNPFAAVLPAMWRYTAWSDDIEPYISSFNTAAQRNRVRATLAASPANTLPMTPDPVQVMKNQSTYVYATATGFGWKYDTWDINGPIKTITRVDHRYSIDGGKTFLVETNVGEVGTKTTGVPYGLPIGVQNSRWSADGQGPWSVNTRKVDTAGGGTTPLMQVERFVVQPSGTATGTPVNVQAPQIVHKPLLNWAGPYYEAFTGEASPGQVLTVGYGWWTGNLTGGFTFKWYAGDLEDGSDKVLISGATSQNFTVTSAQAGKQIFGEITSVNGTAIALTAPVSCAAPSYPAMTLTAFDGTSDGLYRTTAPVGFTDSKYLTMAIMGAMTGEDTTLNILYRGYDLTGNASTDILVNLTRNSTNNAIALDLKNTSGVSILTWTGSAGSSNDWTVADGEIRLMVSVDMTTGTVHVYMNDSAVAGTRTTYTGDVNIPVGSIVRQYLYETATNTAMPAINHRYFFMHNAFIDLSVQGNRDKFLTANIGARGQNVFATDPLVMLYGPAASIGTNYGTSGNFTLQGSVTDV